MRHKTNRRAAFTLVELLAAMAVLAIMLLMFANIFASSGKAWSSGTRRTEQNMNGRAVLEYMCKEISQSIVGSNNGVVFQLDYDVSGTFSERSYFTNTALHFVSTRGCSAAANPDEARLIHYYVRKGPNTSSGDDFAPYQLMRAQNSDHSIITSAYQTTAKPPGWSSQKSGTGWQASVFVDNITQFYVVADGNNATFKSYSYTPNRLPDYVDIVIGFLSEDDARKAQLLSGAARLNYVTKAEKRFTRRIYMQNRVGYLPVL